MQQTGKQIGQKAQQSLDTVTEVGFTVMDWTVGFVDQHTYSHSVDETIHSKGGTVKGFDQAAEMRAHDARQSALDRFQELEDLLFRQEA